MIIDLGSNKKKGCTQCKKLPLFEGFRRDHDRQPYPQFVLERLNPRLKSAPIPFGGRHLPLHQDPTSRK